MVSGPAMLRNENGMLSGYVYVDVAGRDVGSYVAAAKQVVRENVAAAGLHARLERPVRSHGARARAAEGGAAADAVPDLPAAVLNTRSTAKTVIILLAVPFSAVGAIWLLYLLGYNMSIGVWVGLIALMGVDAETGVFMLLYLDLAFEERRQAGRMRTHLADLREAIVHGAVKRIRPKFMTVATMFVGLAPIMWSHGAGADVMKRIAAPMIGGIFTSFLLELVVYPAIYEVWKWHSVKLELTPETIAYRTQAIGRVAHLAVYGYRRHQQLRAVSVDHHHTRTGAGAVRRAQGFQFRIATTHHGSQLQPAVASSRNEERENSIPGDHRVRLADGPLGRAKERCIRIADTTTSRQAGAVSALFGCASPIRLRYLRSAGCGSRLSRPSRAY
jgi:hypothetical protein